MKKIAYLPTGHSKHAEDFDEPVLVLKLAPEAHSGVSNGPRADGRSHHVRSTITTRNLRMHCRSLTRANAAAAKLACKHASRAAWSKGV